MQPHLCVVPKVPDGTLHRLVSTRGLPDPMVVVDPEHRAVVCVEYLEHGVFGGGDTEESAWLILCGSRNTPTSTARPLSK